jgi:[acyl-carrier-protein] S-malonyltransferase
VKRTLVVFPGRGSYTERSLRTLPAQHELLERAEALRAEFGLASLRSLDGAAKFSAAEHLRPAHVSALIYVHSLIDAGAALAGHRPVAMAGNSMGWYTALAAAGALDFEDGFRLVQQMALLQEQHGAGGQLLYPLVDESWRPDPEAKERVAAALASGGGEAFPSIHLGGYAVLAGSEAGLRHLLAALPKVQLGGTTYPLRLLQHGPYHTELVEPVARAARETLTGLTFRAPRVTLIDGRGRRHTPWTADPEDLRAYTLGAQVTEPYDLAASLRVGLREYAPEQILLPGPGNTLGGVVGQALVAEGWRGIRDKASFQELQAGPRPLVVSVRR